MVFYHLVSTCKGNFYVRRKIYCISTQVEERVMNENRERTVIDTETQFPTSCGFYKRGWTFFSRTRYLLDRREREEEDQRTTTRGNWLSWSSVSFGRTHLVSGLKVSSHHSHHSLQSLFCVLQVVWFIRQNVTYEILLCTNNIHTRDLFIYFTL